MSRQRRSRLSSFALLVLAAGALAAPIAAKMSGRPFYLIPATPGKECHNVTDCVSVVGPWVIVQKHAEATYLIRCPKPQGYLIGGTDAHASSSDVRVRFDGQLGAPIGTPSAQSNIGAGLLFHADTGSGNAGAFEPILGCVKLKQSSGRSTVSARAAPSPPLALNDVVLEGIAPQTILRHTVRCKHQKVVGTWNALTFPTGPPPLSHVGQLVRVKATVVGTEVRFVVTTGSAQFYPVGAFPSVQLGVMCKP